MNVTIYDVAAAAGVSPSTVSRVLNGSTLVNHKTKDRVERIAREMGYTKNGTARRPKKGQTIAVLVSDVLNHTLGQMIKGVQNVTKSEGLLMVLFDSDGQRDEELSFLQNLKSYGISGVIVSGPNFCSDYVLAIRQQNVPFVLALSYSNDPLTPCVYINNCEAAFEMMHTLLKRGHQRIATITGPEGDLTISSERLLGCRLAFKVEGLDFPEELTIEGDYSVESGYEAVQEMLQWNELPTAIFAFSDTMALGALQALQERGIGVPSEVSIAGFDGIESAALVSPRLTTVKQPSLEIGSEAAQALLTLLSGKDLPQLKRVLPYRIVSGETIANPRKARLKTCTAEKRA